MDKINRRQLTLFVDKKDAGEIESIRKKFNSIQHQLIASHVTLCRENEIQDIDKVQENLHNLDTSAVTIQFGQVTRFDNGNGVLIPALGDNEQFHCLREKIVARLIEMVRGHEPHITLMHPRNSNCTDDIFKEIQSTNLPRYLKFHKISLIEQVNGGPWQIIKSINLNSA